MRTHEGSYSTIRLSPGQNVPRLWGTLKVDCRLSCRMTAGIASAPNILWLVHPTYSSGCRSHFGGRRCARSWWYKLGSGSRHQLALSVLRGSVLVYAWIWGISYVEWTEVLSPNLINTRFFKAPIEILTLGQVMMSVVASDMALTMGFSNTWSGISKSKEYSIIASIGQNVYDSVIFKCM